ncbi:hypothetical protein [Microbacterium sp. 3J1]|uniref:hypothetical protein n=1 Tax=Microbacterium sp. 3J1 TaxID=861269 RepID=UPI000B2B94F9|nr:hypothetical protein [Microbacterium sp. 3J1]
MIDARDAAGVPCITTCPITVPRGFLVVAGAELHEWQERLLRARGFIITDQEPRP